MGIARYLVYDGMLDDRTVYRGVQKLPAASWVELDTDGNRQSGGTFWRFESNPRPISVPAAEDQFLEHLKQGLALRLRSDVPVGLFLSGGIDSSLLAAVWRMIRPHDVIQTFTIGFEEPSYDERWSAELMARAIGSEHHVLVISNRELERELDSVWDNLSEPFGDPSVVPTSLLCRFARKRSPSRLAAMAPTKCRLATIRSAPGACGMMERVLPRKVWYAAAKTIERLSPNDPANMSLRFKARHFSQGLLHPPEERIQGWMASFPVWTALGAMHPDLARQVNPDEILEPTRRAFHEAAGAGELHAQINTWVRTDLECSILTKVDRASMMHALEVRAPYLDPDLAKFLSDLPANLIFRGGKGKYLMRRVAKKLIPAELLKKKKKGFGVPQATWLTTVLRARMEDALERTAPWRLVQPRGDRADVAGAFFRPSRLPPRPMELFVLVPIPSGRSEFPARTCPAGYGNCESEVRVQESTRSELCSAGRRKTNSSSSKPPTQKQNNRENIIGERLAIASIAPPECARSKRKPAPPRTTSNRAARSSACAFFRSRNGCRKTKGSSSG